MSNYPQCWCDRYVEKNYLLVDPVITKAKHGPSIFSWSSEENEQNGRRYATAFFKDAGQFGIRCGFSISAPLGFRARMVFTLASDKSRICDEKPDTATAIMAVALIHSRLGSAASDVALACGIHLSPREAECLRWFADGMSMPDIANILGIGYRSVRSYLDEATRKLGAMNSRQAASIAIRLGLI